VSQELKPCPFCGTSAAIFKSYHEDTGLTQFTVVCNRVACPAQGRTGPNRTEEKAIAAWNRRAPAPDAEGAALAQLAAMRIVPCPAVKPGELWVNTDDFRAYLKERSHD
jgi:Lar family restriction alleviation protein